MEPSAGFELTFLRSRTEQKSRAIYLTDAATQVPLHWFFTSTLERR